MRNVKAARLALIRELVERGEIETQEELAAALQKGGVSVTQATVSRDIKELGLYKVPRGDGSYRYAYPAHNRPVYTRERLSRLFHDAIVSVDCSEELVIVKTAPGSANAVAVGLDHADWREIIGTLAGDDSILVVVKPKSAAPFLVNKIKSMM